METGDQLELWRQRGILSDAQHAALSKLTRKERFSLFLELNAILYIGVLALVAGIGLTVQAHFARLGDTLIITTLSLLLCGSLYYCFSHAAPYSEAEVELPSFVLDYVLYVACLLFVIELGYLESRFEWLRDAWPNYLLFASAVFFAFAYRFDNRFVLSLALSSLAGWLGLKVSGVGLLRSEPLRQTALLYGAGVIGLGNLIFKRGVKKHFLDTYLHVATNVILLALVSGVFGDHAAVYLLALFSASAAAIALGVRFRRFAYVAYGAAYGYLGVSAKMVPYLDDLTFILLYLIATGGAMIVFIAGVARRFGREE
jgi:hypothetical protein